MSVENFLETGLRKNLPELPKCHRTSAAYSSKSPFKRNTCIQAPQAVRRDRFQTCIAFLANCDAVLVAGLRVSSYRRQFTYGRAIKQGDPPAPGAHRHVRRRENVLDKEVSGKRRSCHFLRRPHRAKAGTASRRRRIRRNQWRGRVDGLAGQPYLWATRIRLLDGGNSHA